MALKNDFYNEIFVNEKKWIELINAKLLNSIYCNLTLKPFYIEKKKELEEEYDLTNNKIIGQIISIIDQIINKIEMFNEQYKNFQSVNIDSLLPLFLTAQMSNVSQKEENTATLNDEINKLQIKKQILENKIKNYNRQESINQFDYVYDDLPEEPRKII